MNHFKDRNYLKHKLKFTQQKALSMRYDDSKKSQWLYYHLQIMQELGYFDDKLMKYCKGNWKYVSMRQAYIDISLKQYHYDEAIKALNHSIKLDKDDKELVIGYRYKLKDIYHTLGNNEEYKNQLMLLVTIDNPGNVEDFKELKALYDEAEWKDIREDILMILPDHCGIDKLYKEEKLYDRLLNIVINEEGLYKVFEFEDVLKDEYPQELLDKYRKELNKMAYRSATRDKYRTWVQYLRRMKDINGGEKVAQEIVDDWKVKYKNRPALMEELKRL